MIYEYEISIIFRFVSGYFFMGSCNDFDLDTLTGKERLAGVVDGKKMSCCSVWDRARK